MKNVIVCCIVLLSSFFSYAQDCSALLSMDKSQAETFSKTINSEIRTPWKFLYAEDESYLRFYYVPANTSAATLTEIKDRGLNLADVDYYYVEYIPFMDGEDIELEIEGTKKYQFSTVKLKFLDAFKVWEKLFFNGTTIERVRNNEDLNVRIENPRADIKFLSRETPYWKIVVVK